jgi:hypothetical protein
MTQESASQHINYKEHIHHNNICKFYLQHNQQKKTKKSFTFPIDTSNCSIKIYKMINQQTQQGGGGKLVSNRENGKE